MRVILTLVAFLSACAPAASTPASFAPSAAPASSTPSAATASANIVPSPAATPSANPAAPSSPVPVDTPAPYAPPDPALAPTVSVGQGVFPIMTTLRTKLAVVDEQVVNAARWGVERYLDSIDSYRNGQSPALPITGPFLAAVSTALKESATPGVRRKFQVESLTVDRHVQKPWGTHAYVDVTVTLVDKAVDGNAPDQRETGKLRLSGDKLFVTDGWDFDNARWFNGFGPLPLDQVRVGVAESVSQYLYFETWTKNTTPIAISNYAETPFQRVRQARVTAVDRKQVMSLFFEGVSASIERFETIDGLWSGVATVRLDGTVVTTNAAGKIDRAKLDRHVRAFVLGNWMPEVVDDQLPARDWTSGGDLALGQIDVNRA